MKQTPETDQTGDVIFQPPGEPGPPPPPEPPDPSAITGPIGTKWKQLGGMKWGAPVAPPASTGNGGKFVDFRHASGPHSTIFWSAATGARVVSGPIRAAHQRLGRTGGLLGFPTSDGAAAHDKTGRYQSFQGGMIVWHPATGAFEVHGRILEKYGALGGSAFGYPTTDEGGTPDGRGRFNHFRNVATGGDLSIYWTPTTDAQPVYGYIRRRWAEMKWERSPLGYPRSDELMTHDGRGRYQLFEQGSMVWSAETGAHAVHGEVLDLYGRLGGSAYGYPTTELAPTPNGRARYQHYRDLAIGTDKSIYWTPEHGAHPVYGLIRQRWAELDWERSILGFPTGAEETWNGATRGRKQSFEGGTMYYPGFGSAYSDPMRWRQSFKGGGFSGDLEVIADATGRVRVNGSTKAGWPAKFSYIVQAMVTSTSNLALVFPHRGTLTAVTQADHDSIDDDVRHDMVRRNFREFSLGALRVDHSHSNDVTEFLGDISGAVTKWCAGGVNISPTLGLVFLGGAELAGLVAGGDLGSGTRIAGGLMWLAGPTGTVIALAADGFARLATHEDTLGQEEYDRADLVFKGTLPKREDIVIADGRGAGGHPFTFPRWDGKFVLNLGDDAGDPWNATFFEEHRPGQLLIHELTHAWHYHHDPSLLSYVASPVLGDRDHPGTEPTGSWRDYSQEQKSVIVDEWFTRHYDDGNDADSGLGDTPAIEDSAFVYIRDKIRTGRTD